MAGIDAPTTGDGQFGLDRHVRFQLVLRIIHFDLDAVDELAPLLGVWICFGVNSASEEMKVTRPG